MLGEALLASKAVVRVGPGTPAAHCPRKVLVFRRAAMLLLTSTFPENVASFQSQEHVNDWALSDQSMGVGLQRPASHTVGGR